MSETKQITGVCVEVAQKPGSEWCEFHVDTGGKYPVRLSTKLAPLIESAKGVGAELATWTFKEIESDKINEKSGKPFINRYLDKVEVGGSKQSDASDSPSATQARPPVLGGDKDRLIVRQVCIKAAAELWAPRGVEPDPALEVMKAAQRFETWIYRDLEAPPF